jgi:hypothetical protein
MAWRMDVMLGVSRPARGRLVPVDRSSVSHCSFGLAGARRMMAGSVRKPDRESLRTRHQEAPKVNARTWFRTLFPLAIMVLPFVVAACNHGPGGSGGAPGY